MKFKSAGIKTFSAYAFWWWLASFGGMQTINGWCYKWSEAQFDSWAVIFVIGLMVLMILNWKRWLK